MLLIAKQGTAFEQTLKDMCEEIATNLNSAMDLVEKNAGIRPKNIIYMFHWGIINKLTPDFVFDQKDNERINRKFLRKKSRALNEWVPAARHKEGRDLDVAFRTFASQHTITDDRLNEFGIHMVDEINGMSYWMQPGYNENKGRYVLYCSDSTPKAFDKKKLAKDQFDIEY